MTSEQLIIYIYGIYPTGGISVLLVIATVLVAIAWAPITDFGEKLGEGYQKWLKIIKPLSIVTAVVMTLGYFVPDKNTFLLMVATPTIVESMQSSDGKLNRLDKLIDQALLRADEILKEQNASE